MCVKWDIIKSCEMSARWAAKVFTLFFSPLILLCHHGSAPERNKCNGNRRTRNAIYSDVVKSLLSLLSPIWLKRQWIKKKEQNVHWGQQCRRVVSISAVRRLFRLLPQVIWDGFQLIHDPKEDKCSRKWMAGWILLNAHTFEVGQHP